MLRVSHHRKAHYNALVTLTGVLCFAALIVPPSSTLLRAYGAGDSGIEFDVKAAMVYNFAKFTEWPAATWKDAQSPVVLCVFGTTSFDDNLERAVEMRTIENRAVRVHKINSPGEAEACQVLYVSRSDSKHLREILRAVESKPVLTISDLEGFAREGGMIGFVTVDRKIRFNINPARASRAGISISSKLLKLANSVETGGGN